MSQIFSLDMQNTSVYFASSTYSKKYSSVDLFLVPRVAYKISLVCDFKSILTNANIKKKYYSVLLIK